MEEEKERAMDIKTLVKETAYRHGMDLCGIASVDRFNDSPPARHPTKILPGCKSVIVVAQRVLDGVTQVNFRAFEDGRDDLKGIYGTYGYTMLPNFALTYACYAIAQTIERATGEVATPTSTGPMTNGNQISLRHCAVAAGLGEFGWMSIVLTPQFGPRQRFGVVLTTAEIEPDPMYDGPQLCDPTKCKICTDVCPTKAIGLYGSEDCHSATLGDKTYTYAKINFPRCQMVCHAFRKEFGGEEDLIDTYDPTAKDIAEASAKSPISGKGLQHLESWHCGRYQAYCPVGNWQQKFAARNLSGGIQNVKRGNRDE